MRQPRSSSSRYPSMTGLYASSIFSLGSFTGICGERSGAASFAYTVLRETPTFRAISEMDSPLLRSWRIE